MNFRVLLLSLLLVSLAGVHHLHAQEYKTAAGLRLGSPSALSLKYFLSEPLALEVYAGGRFYSWGNWLSINGAFQYHTPLEIEGIEGLQWYVGAGAGAYFWNYDRGFGVGASDLTIGIQGYLGLDWYPTPDLPLAISADWVPTLFVGDAFLSGFGAGYGTVGIRYILSE